MSHQNTQLIDANDAGIERAVAWLRSGGLVAFATETVYGLGADATNDTAVARIFQAKDRPQFNPLIVHVPDVDAALALAHFNPVALRLADAFWPGPLTLVLPLKGDARISPLISAGLPTVAIRVPDHDLARKLLGKFGAPVAAPSANRSGTISPTQADHVIQGLGGRIDAVLDAGPCAVGIESTIVGVDPTPTLLRPGGLPVEIIEQCIAQKLALHRDADGLNAPGQMRSHYAPVAPMRLNASGPKPGETLLGFGPVECDLNLSPSGDLVEAAANLFHHLHRIDDTRPTAIAVSPIPTRGLGRAINDRLQKAAAPRP